MYQRRTATRAADVPARVVRRSPTPRRSDPDAASAAPAASDHRYEALTVHAPVRPGRDVAEREREADRAPAIPLRHARRISLEPAGYLPGVVRSSLVESASSTLPEAPHVRVHTGIAARRAADALGAHAFTIGRHVVVGRSPSGGGPTARDPLVGHEMVHVEQQAAARRVSIDRKARASPVDPYPALTRRIAEERTRPYPGILGHLTTLRLLEDLAKAVEARDLQRVKALVPAFIARDTDHPLDPASAVVLDDVPMTLVARTFLLGLTDESARLERHFFRERSHAYEQPARDGDRPKHLAVLTSVVEEVTAGAAFGDAARAEAVITRAAFVLRRLNVELARVDLKQVRKERDDARRAAAAGIDDALFIRDTPGRTEGSFYSGIVGLVRALVPTVQRAFQVLVDAAIAEVERGAKRVALTKARAVLDGTIRPALTGFDDVLLERQRVQGPTSDPSFGLDRPSTATVEITRSDFERRQKRHLDYFDRTRRAPSVDITAYDRQERSFSEKEMSVERLLQIRERQIALLERLAGVGKDAAGRVTAESKQEAKLLAGVKQFSLHGNDGWRQFLLAKFKAAQAETKDDWKALLATVGVLRAYLGAFTIHTPYNIDEFGDNYLSRTFPRAMTGQLIHDCGVYALRVAYLLSLVRDELKLTFRAAVMPAHVGLVISFGDDVSRGALYVNNNTILPIDGGQLAGFAAQWQATTEAGTSRAKPAPLDVSALHAEVIGATFVEAADVTVRLVDVPRSPAGQTPGANKAALWAWYHRINQAPALRPVTGTPQPELRYLAYLDTLKDIHNRLRVPAYARAHEQFRKDRPALEGAARDLRSSDPGRRARALGVLRAHKAELEKIFRPLRDARAKADSEGRELSTFMRSNRGAVGVGARVRSAQRLNLSIDFAIDEYLGAGGKPGSLEAGLVIPDGWSAPDRLPGPAD